VLICTLRSFSSKFRGRSSNPVKGIAGMLKKLVGSNASYSDKSVELLGFAKFGDEYCAAASLSEENDYLGEVELD